MPTHHASHEGGASMVGVQRSMTDPALADLKGNSLVTALSARVSNIVAGANTAINEAMEKLQSLDEEDAQENRDPIMSEPKKPLPPLPDVSDMWFVVSPLRKVDDGYEPAEIEAVLDPVWQEEKSAARTLHCLAGSPTASPVQAPPQVWQLLSEGMGKAADTVMGRLEELDAWAEATVGGGSAGSAAQPEPSTPAVRRTMTPPVDPPAAEKASTPSQVTRCEGTAEAWLNSLTAALWPQISNYLAQVLRSVLEPVLRDALPSFHVRFTTLKLGPELPTWGTPSLRSYGGGLRIDVSVSWEAQVDVAMGGLPADVGVNRASLEGDVAVILRPFLPRPPFLGSLEAFFPNPPAVRLSFTGLGHVARLPGLSGHVQRAVDSGLARVCVLPRRLCVPLEAPTPLSLARMRCPAPIGFLQLTLVQAEGLAQGSIQERIAGPTAPSVRISLGADRWTSEQASGGMAADAGESLWIWPHAAQRQHSFIVDCRSQLLHIEVLGSRGGILARACCSVANFPWPPEASDTSSGSGHGVARIACQPRGTLLLDASWLVAKRLAMDSAQAQASVLAHEAGNRADGAADSTPSVLLSAEVLEARIPPYLGREALSSVRVRVQVATPSTASNCGTGQTLQTGLGRAPWAASSSNHLGPRDDLLLSTMQRMWSRGMSPQTIAEVLDLETELVESYCQTALEEDSLEEREAWLRKLRKAHAKHAALSCPQFAEVLHFTAPPGVGVTFELIDAAGEVRFRSNLVKAGAAGPFDLSPVGGFGGKGRPAAAKVYGSLRQHTLSVAHPRCYSDPTKKINIEDDASMLGSKELGSPRPAA
mmetsp:Transcript_6917/g.12255  ORF Transcript_6917/g.12255 Transcript_6917/m.12255 type:complete len:819 (-) Transcript_6917:75-2531(-)